MCCVDIGSSFGVLIELSACGKALKERVFCSDVMGHSGCFFITEVASTF